MIVEKDENKEGFHTTQVAQGEDVDFLLDELRQTIMGSHERGSSVIFIRMKNLPTSQ
jgi:hypothetical protein